jgi:NADPH:quinone reductase-like Zn-dependent oxidoreductase
VVMTGYGPPEVLTWAAVPLPEPGRGQIRIKVRAAGISPTDLALRAGYLTDIPLMYSSKVTRASLAGLRGVGYARLSSSTGMVRTPAVWRAYSAKPG